MVTVSYLSRIWLNPRRRKTRGFISNPQLAHAAVLAGLPMQPVDERVLWRIDQVTSVPGTAPANDIVKDEASRFRFAMYVVTSSLPSWEHIVEQAGWPSSTGETATSTTRSYEPLLDGLQPADEFAFRLTANPTKSVRSPRDPGVSHTAAKRERGKRVGHVTAYQQLDWFLDRTDSLGFDIPFTNGDDTRDTRQPDVTISRRDRIRFHKGRGKQRPVTISTATFDGHLVVRDPDKLRLALVNGIGPSKAYGCGLLTLARPARPGTTCPT